MKSFFYNLKFYKFISFCFCTIRQTDGKPYKDSDRPRQDRTHQNKTRQAHNEDEQLSLYELLYLRTIRYYSKIVRALYCSGVFSPSIKNLTYPRSLKLILIRLGAGSLGASSSGAMLGLILSISELLKTSDTGGLLVHPIMISGMISGVKVKYDVMTPSAKNKIQLIKKQIIGNNLIFFLILPFDF